MVKGWITGKDIMEQYNKAAVEIGQDCYKSDLIAYCQPGWGQIYDISQLERVPKHPPVGVDALLYKQKGEDVRWDWPVITGVGELEHELNKIKYTLREAIAVWRGKHPSKATATLLTDEPTIHMCPLDISSIRPYEIEQSSPGKNSNTNGITFSSQQSNYFADYSFDELDRIIHRMVQIHNLLEDNVREKKEIPLRVQVDAQIALSDSGVPEEELYSRANAFAWNTLMQLEYSWYIDGKVVETTELDNSRLFYFDFDMYLRSIQGVYRTIQKKIPSAKDVASSYNQQLGEMWFKEEEVKVWYGSCSQGEVDENIVPKKIRQSSAVKHEITQTEAAKRLGVTGKTIRNWENETHRPPKGYPGRTSRTSFMVFEASYKTEKALRADARAKNGAITGVDIDSFGEGADY